MIEVLRRGFGTSSWSSVMRDNLSLENNNCMGPGTRKTWLEASSVDRSLCYVCVHDTRTSIQIFVPGRKFFFGGPNVQCLLLIFVDSYLNILFSCRVSKTLRRIYSGLYPGDFPCLVVVMRTASH